MLVRNNIIKESERNLDFLADWLEKRNEWMSDCLEVDKHTIDYEAYYNAVSEIDGFDEDLYSNCDEMKETISINPVDENYTQEETDELTAKLNEYITQLQLMESKKS